MKIWIDRFTRDGDDVEFTVIPKDQYERMLGRLVRPEVTGATTFEEHVKILKKQIEDSSLE